MNRLTPYWLLEEPYRDVLHVHPFADERPHHLGRVGRCWCRPTIEDEARGIIVIHNALDGREAYESGQRKLN